jgi:hypothetical protein
MGDTDQRPKQVEGVEISTDVTALDRAIHQRINRSMDQPLRTLNRKSRCAGERLDRVEPKKHLYEKAKELEP